MDAHNPFVHGEPGVNGVGGGQSGQARPEDECPFAKPFPPGFDDCVAYSPVEFVGLDTKFEPLRPVWTCGHLEAGQTPGLAASYYGRCRLGTAAERARWGAQLEQERVRALKELFLDLNAVIEPLLAHLWAAKGQQLRAGGDAATTQRLEETQRSCLVPLFAYVDANAARMNALGLPADAFTALFDEAAQHLVRSSSSSPIFQIPDEILDRFPEEIRVFFRPQPELMSAKGT